MAGAKAPTYIKGHVKTVITLITNMLMMSLTVKFLSFLNFELSILINLGFSIETST